MRRHGLHRRSGRRVGWHPLYRAALSGVWFWLGNSGIILGNEVGLPVWSRAALSWVLGRPVPPSAWEEMAVFHVFGMLGNHWIFAAYEWVALAEAREAKEPMATRRMDQHATAPLLDASLTNGHRRGKDSLGYGWLVSRLASGEI